VGCTLASRLVALKKQIKRDHNPDYLFIEPSEMVVTRELREVAAMGRRDVTYAIGPFVTLVDGPAFEAQWQERAALIGGQVAGADIVAVNKTDTLAADQLAAIAGRLDGRGGAVIGLSAIAGQGLGQVIDRVAGD